MTTPPARLPLRLALRELARRIDPPPADPPREVVYRGGKDERE